MTHASLFSGIGGFDLAAHWAGWRTLVTCEIDSFCRQILQYHFPKAYHHDDIHTLTYETIDIELSKRYGTLWRNEDIVLTGGFPTQPPVCGGDDGFPGELAGIAFPRWRREAVKACGNAIVPQVALQIFETINEYERK